MGEVGRRGSFPVVGTASDEPGGQKQHDLAGGGGQALGMAVGRGRVYETSGRSREMALGANPSSPYTGWVTPSKLLISELVCCSARLGNDRAQLLGLW